MKKQTLLLKIALICVGLPILALGIFFIVLFSIEDETLNPQYAYIIYSLLVIFYLMLMPFFYAIYQAIRLLTFIDKEKAFSNESINALKYIKYSAFSIILFGIIAMPFVYLLADLDDAPGLILFAMIIPFGSLIVALLAAVLQKLLKSAFEIKTENELTV